MSSGEKEGVVGVVDAATDAMKVVVETTQAAVSPVESFIVGTFGTDIWNIFIVVSFITLILFLILYRTLFLVRLRELAQRTKSPIDNYLLHHISQRALLIGVSVTIISAVLVIMSLNAKGVLSTLSQVNHILFALAILRVMYLLFEYRLMHSMTKAKKRRVTAKLRTRAIAGILFLIYIIYVIAILGIKTNDWLDLNIPPAWFPFIVAGVIVPAIVWFKNIWNLSGYHLGYTGNRLTLDDGTYITIIEHGFRQIQYRRDDGTVGFMPTTMLADERFDIVTTRKKFHVERYFLLDFSHADQERLALPDRISAVVQQVKGTNNVLSCKYIDPQCGFDRIYLKYPIRIDQKIDLDHVQNAVYVGILQVLKDHDIKLASGYCPVR